MYAGTPWVFASPARQARSASKSGTSASASSATARDETIRAYLAEALNTWRNHNAAVLLATQSSEDFVQSDLLPLSTWLVAPTSTSRVHDAVRNEQHLSGLHGDVHLR